ncbi:phthioceranic/hydroxyphthioceranic acid synthase-like [Engraulis encrasicolus]|uniref:phthioceranic/hydroxyphthioceranic acid synthase-like n=1 Tax=Engraulis encrasicolus TaxID=184585 RepID=UPI002FD121A1
MEEIAVVGIGCNFPGGEGLDNFWKVLVEGKNCAIDIPDERFDCSQWYDPDDSKPGKTRTKKAALINGFNEFDHKFFGISDAEADQMDPQHKLLLQCSYRALEDAGIPLEKASGTNTGIYIGLMNRDYEIRVNSSSTTINHYFSTGTAMSVAANRISYTFNFTGPSFALDCACSSSLVALHSACQGIRHGDCDMALCGGVSCIFEPNIFVALSKAKMISPEGTSKPFSSKADGYGRGEGCGIVLLKPLKKALMDSDHIWGVISKTAVNQDGRTVTPITKPSMVQQEELLSRVYSTESDLASVQYIEAHGTGTPVGDPTEAGSISKVIAKARPTGSGRIYMGSVKGNIGHTESAAGVAGLIKVLLMMKYETIVPSVFYTEDGASIDAKALNVIVPTQPEQWKASSTGRLAGVNNFGFGGTNAHVIVKQHQQTNASASGGVRKSHLFVLSAMSEKSLANMIANTADQIGKETIPDLQTLSYTSACRRTHMKHKYRKVFRTSSLADLALQLKSSLDKKITPTKSDPKLVFIFCGNGVTYRGMCQELLKKEPVFRSKVTEIQTVLQKYKKVNLVDALENMTDNELDLSNPAVVQPQLFAVQVALATLLKHWGVRPDAILGHSVGEVAAAHCSGLLSLEDAVKVIHYRSELQSKVTGGKMLVVSNMAVGNVLPYLSSFSGRVCLAAQNSPMSCTLSGDEESILALHQTLSNLPDSKMMFLHVLDVAAAYHSHMMDPILPEVENSIGTLMRSKMDTELYSTVTGKLADNNDVCTGNYWSRNIREAVEFEKALTAAAKDKKNVVFVEIGPRRALYRNIMETLGNDSVVLSSAQPEKDHETLQMTFTKLFELGFNVNWDQFYSGMQIIPTALPRYQFDCVKKSISFPYTQEHLTSGHPVLKQTGKAVNEFTCDLSCKELSYLSEHKNNGVAIIPGALYIDIGLSACIANAKPKAPLNMLQLSINFLSPFLLTKRQPELKVSLEPAEHKTLFKIHSGNTVFASGNIDFKEEQNMEEKNISLDSVSRRCTSVIKSDELYRKLDMGGFQYGSVFQNKADIFCGEELREAYSVLTVPDELLCQLHEFCVHPVIMDYLMQMTLIVGCQGNVVRPSFPSAVGSLTVLEPLQKDMAIYLRATDLADSHFVVCGCLTDKEGKVLVEVRDLLVKYVESYSSVVEKDFFHNNFSVLSEDVQAKFQGKALVFSDHGAIGLALKPYIRKDSKYISSKYGSTILEQGLASILAKMNSNVKKFTDILFLGGIPSFSNQPADDVLSNMANCCEQFRQIILQLRKMNFSNSFRVVTCKSSEITVDNTNPGFVLSGMTRACAAEISEFTFQLIDIGSVSAEDVRALAHILTFYPSSEYPELVIKNGQVLQPQIVRTSLPVSINQQKNTQCSPQTPFSLMTADPFKMTSLSALPSDEEERQIPEKHIEVQVHKICVHSSDYYAISVSDYRFGQTIYWNTHTNQNHKLLALDFSGIVTATGKSVGKVKVGDHIAACYPVMASSKVIIPEGVCYRIKKFPFLKDLPCVSYYVIVWSILYSTLPKKKNGKLGIITSVPDSVMVKALAVIANKSGWNAFVSTEFSGPLQDLNKFDALVLMPPFEKWLYTKASTISGIKNVVVVCEQKFPTVVPQDNLREDREVPCIQTIETTSLLAKGSMRANHTRIYKWLRRMNLDGTFLTVPTVTFQRGMTGSIDLLPAEEPESYFGLRTMSVIVLDGITAKYAVSDIPMLPKEHRLFHKNSVYIVTGGLTGLGFETVKFIAERGGGYIVILSRRSPSTEMQLEIDAVKQQSGAVVVCLQCDIAVTEQVKQAVVTIEQRLATYPIKGVFHSAVVLHDALLGNLDKSLFEKVLKPKVNGVLNLHNATNHCKLDYFVCFSSIASFLGNASQTNYAAANSFLDMFCHYRRQLGLAAQSINWGALNLGLLLNKDHLQKFLEGKGLMVMGGQEILQSLEQCLLINKPQQVVCKFNLKTMYHHGFSQNPSLSKRLGSLVVGDLTDVEMSDSQAEQNEVPFSSHEFVRAILSKTLSVEQEELNDEIFLSALGVDSMLGMTLQNAIFQEREVNVPLVKLLDPNCTVASLTLMLNESAQGELSYDSTSL